MKDAYSLNEMKDGGASASELKDAGVDAATLRRDGYTPVELKGAFKAEELLQNKVGSHVHSRPLLNLRATTPPLLRAAKDTSRTTTPRSMPREAMMA